MTTSTPDTAAPMERSRSMVAGLVRAVRPKQWVKNLLVYAAPAAAGLLGNYPVMKRTTVALVVFIAVSSAVYLVNDIRDVEDDRAHPRKQHRPIASGDLPVPVAAAAAVGAVALAIVLCAIAQSWSLLAVVGVYMALNLGYSYGLKHVALLEMFILASGFVLRTLAGAVATNVPVSPWFLIVVSAGALHIAVSKRLGELIRTEETGVEGRAVLADYSVPMLREIRTVAIAVAMTAYMLWAFGQAGGAAAPVVYELSAVPFALAMFRFSAAAQTDADAETPEEILLHDRQLLAYGAAWVAMFGLGLFMGGA
jgi:decaprenyl-phosphate phosphoribosyltransferase